MKKIILISTLFFGSLFANENINVHEDKYIEDGKKTVLTLKEKSFWVIGKSKEVILDVYKESKKIVKDKVEEKGK